MIGSGDTPLPTVAYNAVNRAYLKGTPMKAKVASTVAVAVLAGCSGRGYSGAYPRYTQTPNYGSRRYTPPMTTKIYQNGQTDMTIHTPGMSVQYGQSGQTTMILNPP